MSTTTPEEILAQQKANCIFCKIIAKEIPSKIVYEDEEFISIMDIRPATAGHVLLLPKEHYPILPIIPGDKVVKMFAIAKKLLHSVKEATLNNKGTIYIANGAVAGQQSPHFLMHIMPREDNDNLPLNPPAVEADLETVNIIKNALKMRFKLPNTNTQRNEADRNQFDDLAEALDSNPEVKKMIIENPENFKNYVKANPQLEKLFANINIDKLSERLKSIELNKKDKEIKSGGADLDKISKLF